MIEYIIIGLLVPVMMIIVGKIMMNKPPKNINNIYGYRTKRSKQNIDTWAFSQKFSGELMHKFGIRLLLISIIVMIIVFNIPNFNVNLCTVMPLIQVMALFYIVYLTEKELKNAFNDKGELK